MTVLHTTGKVYTDILVTCLLDYGEPPEQAAFDNSTLMDTSFTFDEIPEKIELIDKFNLKLIDYGFNYKREKYFPHDDATWFLLEK